MALENVSHLYSVFPSMLVSALRYNVSCILSVELVFLFTGPTWAALDLLPSDDPLCVGSFGTHGTRAGNFTVQNATHIQVFGSRLDSKATGTPVESFAPKASIVMHDIDQREIAKFGK